MFKNYKKYFTRSSARTLRLQRYYRALADENNDNIYYANEDVAEITTDAGSIVVLPQMQCPETKCKCAFSLDDFGKHLALEHFLLKMTDILPKAVDTFRINVALYKSTENYCVKLFMLRDKRIKSNCSIWKEHIPIVLMCRPITGTALKAQIKHGDTAAHMYLMLWFTGNTTLCVNRPPIKIQMVLGYDKYFIHKNLRVYACDEVQEACKIYESGCAVLLSTPEIAMLCKNELLIDVQIMMN